MSDIKKKVINAFQERYHAPPTYVVRAPGRVNLIGEHTDYNDGFVFPMTIQHALYIALRPRSDRHVSAHSLNFEKPAEFDLDNLTKSTGWPEYLKGLAYKLKKKDYTVGGWEGVLGSDIPIGAGLSSSAAIQMAALRAFSTVAGFPWDAKRMAVLAQEADNEWVGIKSGVMDQMSSGAGRTDMAMLLDCRTLETTYAPIPKGTQIVVMDTSTRRGLVDSKYNERREQCEVAATHFKVSHLRDVSVEMFDARKQELDPIIRRRARHVITENARTLQAAEAMEKHDPTALGKLMNESHLSLHNDFEVTNDALHRIVRIAWNHEACYGARMTGGGFGGAAVALVRQDMVGNFMTYVLDTYKAETNLVGRLYLCRATNGAEIITP